MSQIEDLRLICEEFIKKQYSVEELSQILSRIAVSTEMRDLVNEAEYRLENIRFCISDNEQFDEALKVVFGILSEIEKSS